VTHLRPLPRDEWGDDELAALRSAYPEAVVDRFMTSEPPTAISTMLHHPALAGPWLAYNNVLLWSPTLEHRERELMVLRVAWRTRSTYEWVQHVKLGERYGITSDDVAAIAEGRALDSWTPLERDLVAAASQLVDRTRVDDATWARLTEQLDERQLVEVVFAVGTYTCLAMAFNTFGLELDNDLDTAGIPLPE
jgi:4-carboxymuconolactone decarboxylase